MSYKENLRSSLLEANLAKISDLKGCSLAEIEEIKTKQGVTNLPRMYVEFLELIGRSTNIIFVDLEASYSELLSLKQKATDIVDFHPSFALPEDAFVFAMHAETLFSYFHTNTNDNDPMVYNYVDELDTPVVEVTRFSSFIEKSIQKN